MKFTFDGHDYTIEDGELYDSEGAVFDSEGGFVCTINTDITGEYRYIEDMDGRFESHHVNSCSELDAVKAFISGTY